MQKCLIIFLFSWNMYSFGQVRHTRPLKLIIIQPDTAILDRSFKSDIDTLESEFKQNYYTGIKEMEELLNYPDLSKLSTQKLKEREQIKKDLPAFKALEKDIINDRYFHFISAFSREVYSEHFDIFDVLPVVYKSRLQGINNQLLKQLADSLQADFILYFQDIKSIAVNNTAFLKVTSTLYSAKDNQVIFSKTTEADSLNRGELWSCYGRLLCLLTNAVKSSSEGIIRELNKFVR